jgi:hypothetical protein
VVKRKKLTVFLVDWFFLDMFTGLVVDNFAYVFQLFGKVKAIDREEGTLSTFPPLFPKKMESPFLGCS